MWGSQTGVPLVKLQINQIKIGVEKGCCIYPYPKACEAIVHPNQVKQHIRFMVKEEPVDILKTKPRTSNGFNGFEIVPNLQWFRTGTGFQKPLNRLRSKSHLDVPFQVQFFPLLLARFQTVTTT